MTKDSTREWKPVVGFESRYEVSNYGDIWSIRTSRMKKPWINADGYSQYAIFDGKRYTLFAHRMVAEAFHGESNGLVTRHLDGNPQNNFEGNLRWGTVAENNRDTILHGRLSGAQKRTHCRRGHEFTPESTYNFPDGSQRTCRICQQINYARVKSDRLAERAG